MIKIDERKNCHEYCRVSKLCKAKGSNGTNPYDCGTYFMIEDRLTDAEDIRQEQMRSLGEYEEDEE